MRVYASSRLRGQVGLGTRGLFPHLNSPQGARRGRYFVLSPCGLGATHIVPPPWRGRIQVGGKIG
jgi:hypothetical protein